MTYEITTAGHSYIVHAECVDGALTAVVFDEPAELPQSLEPSDEE